MEIMESNSNDQNDTDNINSRIITARQSSDSSQPITFEDLGIKRRHVVEESWLGKIRSFESISKKEWIFWTISISSILTCVGITIERVIALPKDSEDFTLAIVLLFNCVVSIWYIVHGTLFERPYEILVFIISTIVVMLYCIIEYGVVTDRRNTIKLIRLIIVCTLVPPSAVLGGLIAKQFYVSGNLIFRTVGAMQELQSACWMLFLFEDLLKFDFQLAITMVIMILKEGNDLGGIEPWIIGIGVPFALLWMILGFAVVRFESKLLGVTFIMSGLVQPAYNVYKIYDSSQRLAGELNLNLPSFVFAGGSLALILRFILLILFVFRVWRNFGLGLREKVYGEKACCVDGQSTPIPNV